MHCYSLAVLNILLMAVVSSPLISQDAQKSSLASASTSVSGWTPARRQIHFGPQSTTIAQRYLDGLLSHKPGDVEVVIEPTAPESPSLPDSAFAGQDLKSPEVENRRRQVSTQDPDSTDKANLLGPTPPTPVVSWPLPTGQQATTPSTPAPVSGCTTTVMGRLRNPCVRSPEWTSTVTEYTAVDCHGCESVYVVEPRWHCPAVITTVGPLTADGPSTLTSTTCASMPALASAD